MAKTAEEQAALVEGLHDAVGNVEKHITKLGLISINEARDLKGTSRASIFQLIERGRLTVERILGRTFVYRSEIKKFQRQRPGPAIGSTYKPHDEEKSVAVSADSAVDFS